jgi:hypothetical protein
LLLEAVLVVRANLAVAQAVAVVLVVTALALELLVVEQALNPHLARLLLQAIP